MKLEFDKAPFIAKTKHVQVNGGDIIEMPADQPSIGLEMSKGDNVVCMWYCDSHGTAFGRLKATIKSGHVITMNGHRFMPEPEPESEPEPEPEKKPEKKPYLHNLKDLHEKSKE